MSSEKKVFAVLEVYEKHGQVFERGLYERLSEAVNG